MADSGPLNKDSGLKIYLSKGEFVGRFKGCSTDSADDSGAIAADERIIDFFCAIRTPQADLFLRGWI